MGDKTVMKYMNEKLILNNKSQFINFQSFPEVETTLKQAPVIYYNYKIKLCYFINNL